MVNDNETFLEQEHTIDHLYSGEIFQPSIGFDSVWADWIKMGETPLTERAADRAMELIKNDEIPEVKPEITAEVNKLMEAAKKDLLK